MKKKKKVSNARLTSRKRLGTIGPESGHSQQNLHDQEPTEKNIMQGGTSQENMMQDVPQLSLSQTDGLQPGCCSIPDEESMHPDYLKESTPWPHTAVLLTCLQGDPTGTDAGVSLDLHVTSIADITQSSVIEPVSDGDIECNPCVMSINLPESGICETYPEITNAQPTKACHTAESSRRVDRSLMDLQTSETSDGCFLYVEVNGTDNSSQSADDKEGSLIGTCGEWAEGITSISHLPTIDSSLEEENSQLQELNPDLSPSLQHISSLEKPDTPQLQVQIFPLTKQSTSVPETTSQIQIDKSQLEPQGAKDTSCLSDWDDKLREMDLDLLQDQKSEVITSPQGGQKVTEDHAAPCDADTVLSLGRDSLSEDSRGPVTVLDVQDSQLLGALEESLFEPGKNVDNAVTRQGTLTSGRRAIPQADTAPLTLLTTAASAEAAPGPQETRGEDASLTVQGLILELSNLNRLIMSTYRDLRQKRARFPPGRGAASGKRRREM
ncbi:break repair meiotic recombinase recruitment factor 1 [Mixophyes fleayi]|uniref:break repair meiotic recombinase recruitment factor 1 n=1 Tax=Mixophyes fleayi TaxID=3061075 RepID=UPI003F4E3D77